MVLHILSGEKLGDMIKTRFQIFVWIFGCVALTHCQTSSQSSEVVTSAKKVAASTALTPIKIKYAKNFRVQYFDHYKVVTVTKAFSDTADSLQYVLVPRNSPVPPQFKSSQIVRTPIRSLITLSSTHVALTDVLGLSQSIVGNANNSFISEKSQLISRIKQGKVAEVGNSRNFNKELVLSLQADALMMSGVYTADYQKYQAMLGKHTCLIVNTEWLEQHPLARAEWIKFLALFYNKEQVADQAFQKIEANYLQTKKLVANVTKHPTVFLNLPRKGTWYMARGKSYVAQFIKDAGANYLWKDTKGVGSEPLDYEVVFAKAYQADFWLNVGLTQNLPELLSKDDRFRKFEAFQKGNVYNNNRLLNKNSGNDYWMTGLVNPHLVLADLVKIFHPELLPQHQFVYYKKLPAHEDTH